MNIFKKNNDKDTVALWKKEAKRLEKERNELYIELEAIKNYKEKYQDLIKEAKELKDRYTQLIEQTNSIANQYKKKLESIIDTEN